MGISVCPKCGKLGRQHVYKNRPTSKNYYLEYVHTTSAGKQNRCYLGRVKTTDEAMTEFDQKINKEEFAEILNNITNDIRNLLKSYSPNTAVRMSVFSEKLLSIFKKYGY